MECTSHGHSASDLAVTPFNHVYRIGIAT